MKIKIIFIDIDGTLFNDNHCLTEFNKEMCIAAQKQGIIVVINTGRITSNAISIAKQINAHKFKSFVVANNGVHIYSFKDKKLIFNGNINNDFAKTVYRWVDNKGFKCQLYTEDGSFVNHIGENSSYWADVMQTKYTVLNNVDDLIGDIARILIIAKTITSQVASQELINEFNEKFSHLDIKEYRPGIYEITLPKMSKGYGVTYICDLLGISSSDAMAFGDSYNDQWLMQAVGHPVAMDNSVEIIKELSNYICQSNNENGVGNMINKHILK
ncbi:Cof-type HAD-IIB family hydrolase [Spiroplasma endosymbiont of Asaphidion curtum]|uniref:Cof-type HAD-IIB family hydrolase n=1 Tax=Spiroplasma endosymbiont of Asaphidion curtum TaxID=3066281 RepID=UPI00313ECC28